MTNSQIFIFTILGIVWIIGYYMLGKALINKKDSTFGFMLLSLSSCILMFIAIIVTQKNNELHERIKGKCPELEKVDNLYRIK